jgi:excinuclease UvrABC helicase subunit UvrB
VRASVLQCLEDERFDEALTEIDTGVDEIQTFFKTFDRPDLVEESEEISFLREWAEEIRRDRPRSMSQDLSEQMKEAVDVEDFERAAELRDRLRSLSEDS